MSEEYLSSEFVQCLSGLPICELPSADVMQRSLFMLSRRDNGGWQSRSCTYQMLFGQLSTDLLPGLSVGSMAFQNKWKYALSGHTHDGSYNKLEVSPNSISFDDKVMIASIRIGEDFGANTYDVFAPKIEYTASVRPEVGTLKFVYSAKKMKLLSNADLSADDWDGWAYPDGSSFEVDPMLFAEALSVYGCGENKICLPKFEDFFEACQDCTIDCKSVISQRVSVGRHTHKIGSLHFDGELKMKSDCTLPTYVNNSGSDYAEFLNNGNIHRGTDSWDSTGNVQFDFDLGQVQFQGLSCGDCEGCLPPEQGEFRPRNVRLPVMIYIGGVK